MTNKTRKPWTHRMLFILVPGLRGICAQCGEVDVKARRNAKTGHVRYQCVNARREQRGTDARKIRNQLGVTSVDVDRMLERQAHRCAICAKAIDASACVDHDHRTNDVRGLLCRDCNFGLGWFRDDPAALRRAAMYVEQPPGK